MFVPEFEYHRPKTVPEACSLLASLDGEAAPLAGGTEIVPELKNGDRRFDHLVALSGIHALRDIDASGEELVIGSMATPRELARSDRVLEHWYEIAEVTTVFAATQVGNRATVGGNLATAVPSADFPPILIALRASCTIVGPDASRSVPVEDVFLGPRKSILRTGELITEIRVPPKPPGTGAMYLKLGLRDASVCAVAGVAAAVTLEDGVCRSARIVLGAVAPEPLLAVRASKSLEGLALGPAAMAEAARIASEECAPISDIRGSAEYRRDLVGALTARALEGALLRGRQQDERGLSA